MPTHPPTPVAEDVAVHLLDSAQGHPVQTWRFTGKSVLTIGRSPENDVAIADQHVSRVHARLLWQEGQWMLVSTGRHGTLVNDRVISEAPLGDRTTFRLGAGGPLLRFQCGHAEEHPSETIAAIPADLLALLGVDETRKQQEVDEISNDSLFQQIQEHARRLKQQDLPSDPLAETEIP
jgi:pSer/pThr/pTyr-binding forkhead associated (FHA) protein